jgi:zinc-ribbon domain
VQSLSCPSCGAPVGSGALYCTYCGTPIQAPSAPLPSAGAPAGGFPAGPPTAPYAFPPAAPSGRRRSRRLIVVVLVVVILLIATVVAYELLPPAEPQIQVAEIDVWAPDNVCGLNATPIYYDGYNSSTNAAVELGLSVPNFNSTACTVTSVTTNSTGFSLSAVQVPLTIPASGNGSMNLTLTSPGSSFSGNVNLVFL